MKKPQEPSQHQLQDLEINETLSHIRNKILVMSGKGGVGKSSVAAYLSVSLARKGYKVGLMDVDLHGPSIPRMLGMKGSIRPGVRRGKAQPVDFLPNLRVISIEALMEEGTRDTATIWRGPLKIGVIRQFIADMEWTDLDYMIIDSPPGTGDEPLTVAQTIRDAWALIVTTPQEISLADVRKSIHFCRQVGMKILGLVENMSAMVCPHCARPIEVFKSRGGMLTAKKEGLRLLGTLPLDPAVVKAGDLGNLDFLLHEEIPFSRAFATMVEDIARVCDAIRSEPLKDVVTPVPLRPEKRGSGKVLAVPVADGKLAAHFGHGERFAFIETENGRISRTDLRTPPPHEPGVIPRWLCEQGADVVIAGGMGDRAQEMLRQNGMEVIIGAPADTPESLAQRYLSGTLASGENICDH